MKNFLAAVICVAIAAFARDARAQGDAAAGKELFKSNCSPCHGESGKGDGPGGQVLPVKPANLGERIGATRYSDQYLFDVIAKGGASVGKSNFMPAWSGALNDKQIHDLVAFLQTLAVPTNGGAAKK